MRTPSKPLDDANTQVGVFHESQWWSDFYDSDEWDRGKTGEETNFNERILNIVRYSNVYLQNTGINGLSTFDTNTTEPFGYKEYNDVYGDIIAIMEIGDTLKVYQKTKPSSTLVGMTEYVDTSGSGQVMTSSNLVLGAIRYSSTNYGTEFPESLTRNNRYVYGWDIYNGVVWRDSANGIFPISGRYESVEGSADYRMATWFKEKAKALLLSGVSNVDVMSTFDEEYKLFILSFRDSITEDNNTTIAFHEPSNRWISFYDYELVDHDGYNTFLELTYEVLQGFEAGIGYYFNAEDRFSYFEIVATANISVYPTLITLNMAPQTPSVTASGSGTGILQELNFALQTPSISISYVHFDVDTLTWAAEEYGVGYKQSAIVTMTESSAELTVVPTWFTITDTLGFPLSLGSMLINNQEIYIYPTVANTSGSRSYTLTAADTIGNSDSITLNHSASVISPSVQVQLVDPLQMDLYDTDGSATIGSKYISVTFSPDYPSLGYNEDYGSHLYYYIEKNGLSVWSATVFSDVHDEVENSKTLEMLTAAGAGDTIIVYIYYV